MKNILNKSLLVLVIYLSFNIFAGCSSSTRISDSYSNNQPDYSWLNLDTIKAGRFDTGKMWTFEYPPIQYFQEEYNFTLTEDWLDNARMSALRFANYCSASFVSADGLIMTNDHCARESLVDVQDDGEDLSTNGFYAEKIEDERKVPGLYVDQLVLIKDVTDEVQSEIDKGINESQKIAFEESAIREIENKETEATGLEISVVSLFNGGKYSLYGYKRYNDVRLVFAPESQLGFFGGDLDNFTYPRYNLDCSFFRVYDESGEPLKTDNYFRWSRNGVKSGEHVFVVGNPGSTDRLKTVAQLEYLRDIQYPRMIDLLNGLISSYKKLIDEDPENAGALEVKMLSFSNSLKAYTGMLDGLRNPVLMQRKKDFEKKFKEAVISNPKLKGKYGNLWNKITEAKNELRNISNELYVLNLNPVKSSEYFFVAQDLVDLARELKMPESQRSDYYKGTELDSTIKNIFPDDFDYSYNNELLQMQVKMMIEYLGGDPLVRKITGGKPAKDAVDYILKNSSITKEDDVKKLIQNGPDAILSSNDPFIQFVLYSDEKQPGLQRRSSELLDIEEISEQQLGKALFEVYGTSIPPDATFTLRLSDGVVKGFPYNGTEAPPITTFYGMYDRYYSFNKEFPWNLPERWQNPPAEFNLETPFNFVSTIDIIGGNSGSPVINEKAEIVGLAFDGNIQSLPGSFIFTTEENRCVALASEGMIEALTDIYKAERLTYELENGEMISDTTAASSTAK